jgi:hypothetical protein
MEKKRKGDRGRKESENGEEGNGRLGNKGEQEWGRRERDLDEESWEKGKKGKWRIGENWEKGKGMGEEEKGRMGKKEKREWGIMERENEEEDKDRLGRTERENGEKGK